MTVLITPRTGANTRTVIALEGTPGSASGITASTYMPIRGDSEIGHGVDRAETEVPYGNGTSQGGDSAPAQLQIGGTIPCWLEFLASGIPLKMPFGTVGYLRVPLVTGSLHSFFPSASVFSPLSAQIQHDFKETSAIQERTAYNLLKSWQIGYAQNGAAPFDLDFVGGDFALTDLGWSKTDNGITGVSVYNGYARMAASALVPSWFSVAPTNFNVRLETGATPLDAAFNDGRPVALYQGVPTLKGMIELAMEIGGSGPGGDFNLQGYADARTIMMWDCEYADRAVSTSPYPSSWMRVSVSTYRFNRKGVRGGGRAAKKSSQDWMHVFNPTLSKVAAESFGTVAGPYLIASGTADVFSMKPDAGTTVNVTIPNGAAVTTTQIVTALNADSTFAAKMVADVHNGRLRVTSKQTGGTGASSSLQFVTGTANNCASALGFNGTTISGFDAPYVIKVYNSMSSDY